MYPRKSDIEFIRDHAEGRHTTSYRGCPACLLSKKLEGAPPERVPQILRALRIVQVARHDDASRDGSGDVARDARTNIGDRKAIGSTAMCGQKRKPLLTPGGPQDAEKPDVGPDPTVCYACDTFYAVDGRLLRFICTREDGHDGYHEQVSEGVLVFRWADDPYDTAEATNRPP